MPRDDWDDDYQSIFDEDDEDLDEELDDLDDEDLLEEYGAPDMREYDDEEYDFDDDEEDSDDDLLSDGFYLDEENQDDY